MKSVSNMTSDEYEKLARKIYQCIKDAEYGVNTIDVQHNVNVTGASGQAHQVDVYWKFENNGQTQQVLIECKKHENSVDIGRIRDFFGVLYDVGKASAGVNTKGNFVVKKGYQSGANTFAQYYGINQYILRDASPEDLEGVIKKHWLIFEDILLHILSADVEFEPKYQREIGEDIEVVVERTKQKISLKQYINDTLKEEYQAKPNELRNEISGAGLYYIDEQQQRYDLVKIKPVYDMKKIAEEKILLFNAEEMIKFILIDTQTNSKTFFAG
ncbi:MAG: restriction endonuclease [Oscillospiraceae bacterium]|nr:restriction endonuclease [Oscillospiraceae bacterium]